MNRVILKTGKDKPIRNRHHWIFSGAVKQLPKFSDGECLPVYSHDGECLGWGYFNRKSSIIGRMLSFGDAPWQEAFYRHLEMAVNLRQALFSNGETNAFRLINGEGDLLPGLVVDRYRDILVLQISTLGMHLLRPLIVEWLIQALRPSCIYEKSLLPSRKEEGLKDEKGVLYGQAALDEIEIRENGHRFIISALEGQKTGFFLDQREMRQQIKELALHRRVLNCFSYTGGFSVYAAAGGAKSVDSVDISASAIELAEHHLAINAFSSHLHRFFVADAFQFLREQPLDYDLIILDPPAFAKRQKDVVAACRGYKEINRQAMQKMPANSLLLTCSCSYHVSEELFQTVIFQAASEAKRTVKIIGRHRMAADHPINIYHPESDYLKSLLLFVE